MAAPLTPLERVLALLPDVHRNGRGHLATCPVHGDGVALRVREARDGRILLECARGCTPRSICEALGLPLDALFPTPAEGPSDAPPAAEDEEAGDALLPAYVVEAIAEERNVYLVASERDAQLLAEAGYAAVFVHGAFRGWSEDVAAAMAAATPGAPAASAVILLAMDDPSAEDARQVAASLTARGCAVRLLTLPIAPQPAPVEAWYLRSPDFHDVLADLVARARPWTPDGAAPGKRRTRWRLDELLADDAIMRPPLPVVPRLAWAGRSTLLAAAEKTGKSTLTGYVAAAVSRGGEFLGEICNGGDPASVLVVGLEEFIGDAARRLRHFGADATRVHLVDAFSGDPRERPREIREHIEAVRPTLVIVDTLMAYADGQVSDASASSQMQPLVQGLTRLAHALQVALIVVHHARKQDGRYRDSSAIGGAVDVIIEVFSPDEDRDPTLRRARARGRVPVHGFDFRLDGTTYRLATSAESARSAEAPLDQRILDVVSDRPGLSALDVRDAVGARKEDVLRTIAGLVARRALLNDGDERRMQLRLPTFRAGIRP